MACRSGRRRASQPTSFRADPLVARHLISQERLPFTATYFGSIALTLYFAVGVSRPCAPSLRGVTLHLGTARVLRTRELQPLIPIQLSRTCRRELALIIIAAPKHHPHLALVYSASRRAIVVSDFLLPLGFSRLAHGRSIWWESDGELDKRVIAKRACLKPLLVRYYSSGIDVKQSSHPVSFAPPPRANCISINIDATQSPHHLLAMASHTFPATHPRRFIC